jgi:Zincin-like metallopeptidase
VFLVEGGVAACDDGGDPLLGSYVPPAAGASDGSTPTRAAEITVFYRTFRGGWQDDASFDWEAELKETIEHELEHHFAYLAGDDPMDEQERRAIADEAAKIYGTREPLRHEARALGHDVGAFFRRTWPIWLLIVLATIAVSLAEAER